MEESFMSSLENKILREFYEISGSKGNSIEVLNKMFDMLITGIDGSGGRVSVFDEVTGEETEIIVLGARTSVENPDLQGKALLKRFQENKSRLIVETINRGRGQAVFAPLLISGKLIGVIQAQREKDGSAFTRNELTTIEHVAVLAVLLVDNIRLERIRNRSLAEISELMEISAILNSSLDTTSVREKAITAITRLLECEVASLLLVDDLTDELYFEVALGEKGNRVKEIRLKTG